MSKQLRLVSNNQDFKVSDTAEIIRFNMIGDDGQPYPIVKGDKPQFRISALGEYKLIDAQVAGASQVSFNSQQINDPKPLPAGTYNFELWITHQNGTVSIFPDDKYLSFTLNKNIMGFASEKVTNLSLESVETEALKYIDDRVKELKAAGLKGDPGKDATLDIGTDGNWIVNGKDLGRKAQGPAGKDGQPGKNFNIAKTFASKKAMSGDGLSDGDFVMIASNVNDPDNASLYTWTGQEFKFMSDLSGAQGIKGDTGATGADGKQGAKGDPGPQGIQGPKGDPGATGKDGQSAYQIAVNNGYNGDESAWLSSLKGAKGDKGDQGPQGIQGPKGDDGLVGAPGNGIWVVYQLDTDQPVNGVPVQDLAANAIDGTSLLPYTDDTVIDQGGNLHLVTKIDRAGRAFDLSQMIGKIAGPAGKTPVKGTDYWTDADKAEIKSYVDDAILNGKW